MSNKQKSPQADKHAGDESSQSGSRRRGDILESAILQAAWDELAATGYSRLTMEAIAARAKTNKTAVYRRWPSKAKIVVATLIKHMPKMVVTAPDTGNLREDVLTLLRGIAQTMQMIGAETIHGLMVEYIGENLTSALPHLMEYREEDKLTSAIVQILQQAELRGEVEVSRVKNSVLALPNCLLAYEVLTTHKPISEETILGIVDDIFLPLVRK